MTKIYNALNRAIEFLLVLIFSLLVVDVVWQVFGRYVLNQSFSFTEEFARFALIWLTILGAAYLNGRREHLSAIVPISGLLIIFFSIYNFRRHEH